MPAGDHCHVGSHHVSSADCIKQAIAAQMHLLSEKHDPVTAPIFANALPVKRDKR